MYYKQRSSQESCIINYSRSSLESCIINYSRSSQESCIINYSRSSQESCIINHSRSSQESCIIYMLSSKYGFGQSMDCLGQNDTQRGIGAGQATPIGTSSKPLPLSPPPRRDQVCPPAGNECPFLIGARCRHFEEETRQISYFEYYSDMHMCKK